jgi:hypothetical protein
MYSFFELKGADRAREGNQSEEAGREEGRVRRMLEEEGRRRELTELEKV